MCFYVTMYATAMAVVNKGPVAVRNLNNQIVINNSTTAKAGGG